jgi:replicative DNA helicase
VQEFIDGAEQAVYQLARTPQGTATQPIAQVLKAAFEQITAAAERGDRITGISTGYEKLDAKTAGLHDGDLSIIAARPGMGKTSFVLNVAVNVASPRTVSSPGPDQAGHGVERHDPGFGAAVFSLEMPREQLATRMVCSEGRVDVGKLRQGFLQPDDWRRLTEAASYLSTLPLWIDDTPAISLLELRAKVRRIQAEYDRPPSEGNPGRRIGLVVIDYLQLMKGRDGVSSREQEISEISRGLKQLAKELKVAVIALSQLNRAVETRTTKDKRPQLSDLRESGAIEQDADNIIFIYRDEYYNPETTNHKGIAEIIVAKQRNGPTGKVLTRFTSSCTRFDNLAPGDYPDMVDDE